MGDYDRRRFFNAIMNTGSIAGAAQELQENPDLVRCWFMEHITDFAADVAKYVLAEGPERE